MADRRLVLLAGAALAAGCASVSDPGKDAAKRKEIDASVDDSLKDLFASAPDAHKVADRAQAVLVFPKVITAGLFVGGSYGDGSLRKGGSTVGYYSVAGGSVGLLAGAQSRTMFLFFMTPKALGDFEGSSGWTVGGNASAVVVDAGAMARMDMSKTPDVIAMVRDQQGLMASLSLDGTKITKLNLM